MIGGGGKAPKVKFPKKENILDLRLPEAVDLENNLRDYFRSVIASPGMGFTPRSTYNPMDLYAASIEDRPRLISGVTGKGGGGTPESGGYWGGSAFSRLTPQLPNMPPDYSIRHQPEPSSPPTSGGTGGGAGGDTSGVSAIQQAIANLAGYMANQESGGGTKKQKKALRKVSAAAGIQPGYLPPSTMDSLNDARAAMDVIGDYFATQGGTAPRKSMRRLSNLVGGVYI